MKKIIVIGAVFAALSSNAFAKTEGNYAVANLLYSRAKTTEAPNNLNQTQYKTSDDATGFGVAYKHAFNYGGVFVAPGVFAEKLGNKVNVSASGYHTTINVKNRYGAKVDVGYDLEKDLAVYLTGGLAFYDYKSENSSGSESSKARSSLFYGVGISHEYSDKVAFSLEFNTQTLKASAANSKKINVDNNVVKLGLSYKF